jgi:hypothetical protein
MNLHPDPAFLLLLCIVVIELALVIIHGSSDTAQTKNI